MLSSSFESSMPGLYFVGVAAANSFGPVMRFAFGAGFAARTLARDADEVTLERAGIGCGYEAWRRPPNEQLWQHSSFPF